MLVLSLGVALTIVIGVCGQADQEPAKCCIDHQFSARLIQFGGTVSNGEGVGIESFDELKYDYGAKMIWLDHHERDDLTGNYTIRHTIVLDYNTNKEYMTASDGQCYFQDFQEPMREPCIPANSTFMAATRFGFGAELLEVNVWEYDAPSQDISKAWLAVTTDGCVPVAEAIVGSPNGNDNDNIMYFTNFKPSIADRTSLAAPQNCNTPLPQV